MTIKLSPHPDRDYIKPKNNYVNNRPSNTKPADNSGKRIAEIKSDTFHKSQEKVIPKEKIPYNSKGKQLNSREVFVQASAAGGARATVSVGVITTKDGKAGIAVSAGGGAGTPTASISGGYIESSNKTLKDWKGISANIGGTTGIIGIDKIYSQGGKVTGKSISFDLTLNPSVEGHAEVTGTKVIEIPNTKDFEKANEIAKKYHKIH